MTDRELSRLARRARRAAEKAKLETDRASRLKDEVRAEMAARGTKSLTSLDGDKITYVAPEKTVYNERRLRRTLGARLWKRCLVPTFSTDALAGLVQEGLVTMDQLDKCTEIQYPEPYVRIS